MGLRVNFQEKPHALSNEISRVQTRRTHRVYRAETKLLLNKGRHSLIASKGMETLKDRYDLQVRIKGITCVMR